MSEKRVLSLFLILAMVVTMLAACGTPAEPEAPAEPTKAEEAAPAPTEAPAATEAPAPTEAPMPGADKQGGTLVMGFYQEPELLNPLIRTQTVASVAGAFLERGMLGIGDDGSYFADLAAEVPTTENGGVSGDGLTVTINLKEGLVWEDGDPFDCQDVVFTWETYNHPESGAVSTAGWEDVASIDCENDDLTVVMNYSQFYAPFKSQASDSLLPSHLGLDSADMQNWEFNRKPLSLGPYKLDEWVSGDHMTISRNENYEYWATEGRPYIDTIILRWIESREVGKQLIQTGELDMLWDLIEADIPEAETWEGVVVSNVPSVGTERLVFNLRDPELDAPCVDFLKENPSPHWALGDLRVRQAIQLGIDKHTINDKLLYGLATVGTQEQNLGWAKADIPESQFDPEKAKALLEEAGWTDEDGDGIRECHDCPNAEEGTVLKLKIQTTSGNKLREQAEQVIMEMMADIGIELYIENVPSSELFASYSSGAFRKHGQYDILMYTTSGDIDPHSFLLGYHGSVSIPCDDNSGKGFNYARWIDEEADEALTIAGSSPDIKVRQEAYQILAERINEGIPHLYLYDRGDIDLLRENFKGYTGNIWDYLSFNADEWYIEK